LAICTKMEGDFFDRKAFGLTPKKAQSIAVAFSNADGGEFVFGIADDGDEPDPQKRWMGASEIEEFNDILQNLYSLNPSVDFKHEYLVEPPFAGCVLRIFVNRSSSVCKTSDDTVYKRQGAASNPIKNPQKITELSFAKDAASFEDYGLSIEAEVVVDSSEANRFALDLSPPQDSLSFCVNQGLIDGKTFTPTCAGILLFADNPQADFPRRRGTKIVFMIRNKIFRRETT